jgi:copper homeostasis protein
VTRVLTSGHALSAEAGVDTLAAIVEDAAGRIEVLPGGGIRAHNVAQIVRRTGAMQVHARATDPGVIAALARCLADLRYPPGPS